MTALLTELVDFFFAEELRLELLDTLPRGLPLWPAMRVKALQLLSAQLGIAQPPHVAPRAALGIPQRLGRRIDHLVSYNPFRVWGPVDAVVLEHTRPTPVDGEPVDVHTRDIQARLREEGLAAYVLSAPYAPGQDKAFGAHRLSTEAILKLGWFEPLARLSTLPWSYLRLMREFDAAAERRFGARLGASELALRRFQALSGRASLYGRLLARWQPSRVYLAEGYGLNVAFVAAAQSLRIPVVEYQHGAFGPLHLGYAYPGRDEPVPGFPDELRVWSRDWQDRVPFGSNVATVTVHPPSFLEARRRRFIGTEKEPIVLVLSQGLLGDRVAVALGGVLDQFPEHRVLYKLHPGEVSRSASYSALGELVDGGRVRVVASGELGELLARADYAVGVFSTALYEALDLGCRVGLLDLPGVEFARHLVEEGRAEMLRPGQPARAFVARSV